MSRHKKIDGVWDRLEIVMADKGVTKREVARLCGINRRTLIETNRGRMPSLGTLATFCTKMGVSADYILGLPCSETLNVIKDIVEAEDNLRKAQEKALKFFVMNNLADNETQAKCMINYQLNKARKTE